MKRSLQSVAVEDYWKSLPRPEGKSIPLRRDVVPSDIKDLLPFVVISEVLPDDPAILIRLAGTGVYDLFGTEITGINMIKHLPPSVAQEMVIGMLPLHDLGVGAWQIQPVSYQSGVEYSVEITSLPVWGEDGERLLFGVTVGAEISARFDGSNLSNGLNEPKKMAWLDIGNGIPEFAMSLSQTR